MGEKNEELANEKIKEYVRHWKNLRDNVVRANPLFLLHLIITVKIIDSETF